MSEPIQSISQGNYILATQQEVSHDNSLSGNGTVESPLGVLPGYNETVLWSGTAYTGTFSENISSFEAVRFHMRDDTCIIGVGTLYTDDIFSNGNYIIGCGASVWQPGSAPVRVLGVSGNLTGFDSRSANFQWWSKNDGDYANFPVTKVIGINRKA